MNEKGVNTFVNSDEVRKTGPGVVPVLQSLVCQVHSVLQIPGGCLRPADPSAEESPAEGDARVHYVETR